MAAYKKYKSEYASKRTWGLVPVDKTSKGYLWRDLIDNSLRFQNKQLPNSHIQFLNAKEKRPTSISAAKDVKLIDVNILDKKGKPKILTYDTILKHIDDNSKRYGMSSKDILKEYEKKLFIQQDPELRDQLNKKVYSRYDPTKASSRAVLSPFHVHHTAGRGKNAFNVQLGVGTENMAENALRKKFNTDFKVAQTLTDKKNAMKKYINKVSDNLEVRFKNVPYGTRESFPDMLKRVGGKSIIEKIGCVPGRLASQGGGDIDCYAKGLEKIKAGNIKTPGERANFRKLTKITGGLKKLGSWLFGPVEMGTIPLWLAGEALYTQYANKRDLRKALERDGQMNKDKIDMVVATYGQEGADLGDVGLEDWAIEQKDTTPFKESLTEIDIGMPQMRQDLNRTIEYERALQDQEYQKQLKEAQRERYDPNLPMMAGGGIAGLSGGKRFGPPPVSGPVPYGGGLSSQFNRVRKLTG